MPSTSHDTRVKIIAAVEGGSKGPTSIAKVLGDDWLEPNRFSNLRQMLRRMENAGFLNRVRKGEYAVGENWHCRPAFDGQSSLRDAIQDYLVSAGGEAATRAIHDAVGDYDDPYQRRLVTEALTRWFKSAGRGYWTLG